MTDKCKWEPIPRSSYYRKQCGGLVILLLGKYVGLKCVCGKEVE